MFNKKLIIDSLKNLSKPSRMTNKNTFDLKESGSKREGFVSAQEGVDTPIYKAVKTGASPIEGKGLFAEQSIRKGDVIGVSHIRKKFMKNGEEYKAPFPSTVLGYYNHSEEPNVYEVDKGDYILMVAGRDIQRGHEITSDYTKHNIGDLEVPDDFKKGGSIKRPSLPNRKSPRSYSRSFEATNKLFAKNPLFAKSKSRKNKIFDPRAQYFDNGGISKLEGDLISKVIMNRNRGVDFVDRAYALGDNPGTPMFNLPDDEQFGQNMSHKMAWGDDDNGQAWMYPTIMNPNNEAIPVPNQYADYISSEGYKNATGMNQYAEGGLHKFLGGGEPCPPCPDGTIPTRTAAGDCPCPNTTPYRDVTGKPLKVLPKSGTIYVTDLNDPKILEYKRRKELYEMSKKQYSKILKEYDNRISYTKEKIIEYQALLKEPGLTPKERASTQSILNSDNAYLTKYKNEKALLYDDWLIKAAPKLNKNNIKVFAQYNTYDQKNIYNKGVKQYNIYPEYTTAGGETSDRALLYPKPSLTYVFADPKKYTWNEIKKVEIPPIVEEEKEEEKEEEFIPMPIKKPELISTITGDIIGQSEQLLAPEYSPSYPENRIGYNKYNWNSGKNVGMGTKWTLPKRKKDSGGFYDKMSKKVQDIKNYMEGYEDEDGNYIPGEIEKAQQEGRQINFEGHSSIKDKKAQETYNKEYDEYENLKNYQNQMMNLMQYKLNKKQFGGLNKFVVGGMPDPGDITCPNGYTFNLATNKCEKNSSVCPKGYDINKKTGKCVLIVGEPGFIKNDLGEWVQDVEGKTVIEDENDARYKDYLIRKDLSDISKITDFDTRDILFGELSRSINDPRPDNYPGILHKKYYNPETGYDFRGEYEDETNKGDYGSKVQLFNNLTANQFNKATGQKFLNDQGFPTHDNLYFHDRKDYGLKNYTPDGYTGRATLYGSGNFLTDNLYAENKTTNKFVKSRTPVIEDEIDRARLKMFFPDITDEDINRSYKFAADNFASADQISSWDDNQEINRDIPFKDFVAATKDIPSIPGYTDDGIPYFKSESIIDSINTDFTILPNYSEPIDKFILKKTLDDVYPTSMIEQADPSVELYTNPDAPEYYANYPDKPVYYKYNWHKSKPYNSTRPGRYKRQENSGGWNREMSKKVKDIQKYMEGYYDDEGNYFPGEREKAEEEGRQINFQGRTSLKDRKVQKKYNQKWTQYQIDKEAIKKQNIGLLEKYGLSTEEYLKNYKKNGGLIKASDGLGVKQSLSYSPFSYNMPISLAGNTTFNPSQSITYSNPHFGSGILNMFNKKLAKGSYGSPLELSLGRPYFTDDKSLTNSTVDYSKPWQPDIEHYNYIKTNAGFNGWENTIYQNIGDSLGVDPNLLTSSDLKKYAAKEALGTIKPQYKPGKPIDFNLKYSLLGMRQSTTNPTRGFGSLNVGYNPDSGWYGGGEGGAYGVIAKHMTPETYLKRGLKKKGDWAFIPSLSLGFGVRQKAGYTNEVSDKVKIYQSILEKDLQDGTANAEGYFNDNLSGDLLTSNFNYGFRGGAKFQYKPFRNSNWIGGVDVGVSADLLGGREGQMNEIKASYSPYGKISLSLPIEDQLQRLKKKIKNIDLPSPSRKYYEEEDYDEGTVEEDTEKIETETETETNEEPTFDEDIQINFDGQGVGKANCRDGYERPCEKCKCQKIKLPASYTDKRGTHLFGNEPIRFKQGGISLQLTKDEIQKYVDGGYVVEDLPKANKGKISKTGKKITRSNYNPLTIPIKKIGERIARLNSSPSRSRGEIATALFKPHKYTAEYFGQAATLPVEYGIGKRDLVANYFRGNETGFEHIDYDIKSDSGLFAAIEEYGPLKTYMLNSAIPHGESLDFFNDIARRNGDKNMFIRGTDGRYIGDGGIKTFHRPDYPFVLDDMHIQSTLLGIDRPLSQLYSFELERILKLDPQALSEFSYKTKQSLNQLFEQYGKDSIPFEIDPLEKRPNFNYNPQFKFGTSPVGPRDNVKGHMGFLQRTPEKEFQLTTRDLWGFTPAYDKKWGMQTAFQKAQRKAMEMFGKPFVLTQTNPIKFKQGGESNYELGETVDKATMERLRELGYTFEII